MNTLLPQLHINDHGVSPREELFIRARNAVGDALPHKPRGGLWTSTYIREIGSDWIQRGREMSLIPDPVRGFICHPAADARIFTIDGVNDLLELLKHYERPPIIPGITMFASIDFDRIREDFDAIHLTEEGQWRTRLPGLFSNDDCFAPSLSGWDCESTICMNCKFDRIEDLGSLEWRETDAG
jgi:hypothetical protein